MSLYEKIKKINGETCKVAFRHDRAISYFAQIYSPQYDKPVVEYDNIFG